MKRSAEGARLVGGDVVHSVSWTWRDFMKSMIPSEKASKYLILGKSESVSEHHGKSSKGKSRHTSGQCTMAMQ